MSSSCQESRTCPVVVQESETCPGLGYRLSRKTSLSDCNLRQGARHLKGTYKGDLFTYFFCTFLYLLIIFKFVGLKTICFYLLHAEPCMFIWKLPQKLNFGSPIFLHNTFFSKIVVFGLQTTFFDGKTVFFRFLAEIRLRRPIKSHQKTSSRSQSCNFHPTCTLP